MPAKKAFFHTKKLLFLYDRKENKLILFSDLKGLCWHFLQLKQLTSDNFAYWSCA